MQNVRQGIILGIVGLACCLVPAGAEPAAAKVRIEIGDIPANDQSVRWFSAQVDSFRVAHPHIDVVTFGIGGDPRPRRPIDTLPDLPENVIGIESMPGGETAFLAERDLIVPIDRFLPDPQFSLDAFAENLYDSVTYAGKIWGVPWYAEGNFLVYDPAMLKEAGIQRPPETWDELMADVEKLGKDANGDGRLEQWALRIGNKNTLVLMWISLLMQQGINVLDDSGFHFEGEAPRHAFDLLQRLAASPKTRKSEPNPLEPCAFSFETSRSIDRLLKTMLNQKFQIAPVPGFGSHKSMRSRTVYLCVRKSTPEREAASWEFIKWVIRKDSPFPEVYDGYLCRADLPKRPDIDKAPLAGKINIDAALHSVADSIDPAPHLAGRMLAFGLLRSSFNDAIQGKVSYEEGIVQVAEKLNALVKPSMKTDDALELVR
ncbi:MAG: extracellular solute-binding protein [FCB group bacterium]|jgi:ABC-type glycerol-3-phosphate transport system substrate-binding protein|nr:extracellular solute-binding protein [FCB group bacterium]